MLVSGWADNAKEERTTSKRQTHKLEAKLERETKNCFVIMDLERPHRQRHTSRGVGSSPKLFGEVNTKARPFVHVTITRQLVVRKRVNKR